MYNLDVRYNGKGNQPIKVSSLCQIKYKQLLKVTDCTSYHARLIIILPT